MSSADCGQLEQGHTCVLLAKVPLRPGAREQDTWAPIRVPRDAAAGRELQRLGIGKAAHPGQVVRAVAAQRGQVAVLPGLDAAHLGHGHRGDQRRVLQPAVSHPQHRGRLVDERERVAVAGDQHAAPPAGPGRGPSAREHVVGLVRARHDDRERGGAEHVGRGDQLLDEVGRLVRAVRLVAGVLGLACRRLRAVEPDEHRVRPVLRGGARDVPDQPLDRPHRAGERIDVLAGGRRVVGAMHQAVPIEGEEQRGIGRRHAHSLSRVTRVTATRHPRHTPAHTVTHFADLTQR